MNAALPRETPQGQDLTLAVGLDRMGSAQLALTYEAVNVSGSEVYVFNRLYRTKTPELVFQVDPNLVYSWIEGESLHLSKRVPIVPDDIDVMANVIPCAVLLRRGERVRETLELPVPVPLFDGYRRRAAASATARSLAFSLGYLPAEAAPRVNEVRTSVGPSWFVFTSPWDQLIIRATPIPGEIAVGGDAQADAPSPVTSGACPACGADLVPGRRFCIRCGRSLDR